MNVGKHYEIKKYFWLLYPSKEIAVAAAVIAAAYWSKQYNCEVTYFSPESFIVFLQEDGKLKKVLTSDGRIGWTWFDEDYISYFEEVKTEQ
jgi:hypothetical protein